MQRDAFSYCDIASVFGQDLFDRGFFITLSLEPILLVRLDRLVFTHGNPGRDNGETCSIILSEHGFGDLVRLTKKDGVDSKRDSAAFPVPCIQAVGNCLSEGFLATKNAAEPCYGALVQ
jgi:hypothetical protein